jgi:hypothetical protein
MLISKTDYSIENEYHVNIERYIENIDSFPEYMFFGFIRKFGNGEKNEIYEIKQNQSLKNLTMFASFNILAVKKSNYDSSLIFKLNVPNPVELPFVAAISPGNSSINSSKYVKEDYFNNPKNRTLFIEYYRIIRILDKSIFISNIKDVSVTKTGKKITTAYKPDKIVMVPSHFNKILDSAYYNLKNYYLTDTLIRTYYSEESKLKFRLYAKIILSQNGELLITEVAENYKKYMNIKNSAGHFDKFTKVEIPLKKRFEKYFDKLEFNANAKPFFVISSNMHFADSVWWDTQIDLFTEYSSEGLSNVFDDYIEIKKKYKIPEYKPEPVDINSIDSLLF